MRSLYVGWRPNVTVIQEANDLNKFSLENLISSLMSCEMDILVDDPFKKFKFIALNSKGKSVKALRVVVSDEDTAKEDLATGYDEDEMKFLYKRLHYLKKEMGEEVMLEDPTLEIRSMTQRLDSIARSMETLLLIFLTFIRTSIRRTVPISRLSKIVSWQHGKIYADSNEEEENLALVTSTSFMQILMLM